VLGDGPGGEAGGAAGGGGVPAAQPVAAITGTDCGVLTTAASAFSPRTSSDFPWILACPKAAPCSLCPWARFCIASMSTNASTSLPGSSGARRASSASSCRSTASSWRTFPQEYERRREPSVDRRADPAEQHVYGPVPRRVHVLDAVRPAGHPGYPAADLRRYVDPHGLPGRTCSAASSVSPARCASAMTGTSPARDTRSGSKDARVLPRACSNRTYTVSSRTRRQKLRHSYRPSSEGTFRVDTPGNTLFTR
jgi:hypothetical protein